MLLKIEPTGDGQRAAVVYRNRNLRGQFSTPVRYKDHLYGFDQSTLKCLNFRTGEVCWEKTGFDQGTVLLAEARLIILGEYGRLALAQAVPEGYREVGQVRLGEGLTWTMPALADGRLYLRDQTRVRCVDLKARSFNAGSGRPPSR